MELVFVSPRDPRTEGSVRQQVADRERVAAVVRRICRWKRRGKSFAWIARKLNTDDVPTKKGKRWTERQVFRIVHNPLHRGNLHWADLVSSGTHPAIVTWTPGRKGRES